MAATDGTGGAPADKCGTDAERVKADIERAVYEEVERWKRLHDDEFARRKRWTSSGVVLGLLASFGAGILTFERVATAVVEKYAQPSFDIIARKTADAITKSEQAVNDSIDAVKIADGAVKAAESSLAEAQKKAEEAESALDKKIREILSADPSTGMEALIKAQVGPVRSVLKSALGAMEVATREIAHRSGGIATHPPYKEAMLNRSARFKELNESLE